MPHLVMLAAKHCFRGVHGLSPPMWTLICVFTVVTFYLDGAVFEAIDWIKFTV